MERPGPSSPLSPGPARREDVIRGRQHDGKASSNCPAEPSALDVCPTGSLFRTELGTVLPGPFSAVAARPPPRCPGPGIYHAGMASAGDPKCTVIPQRQRLDERTAAGRRSGDD